MRIFNLRDRAPRLPAVRRSRREHRSNGKLRDAGAGEASLAFCDFGEPYVARRQQAAALQNGWSTRCPYALLVIG